MFTTMIPIRIASVQTVGAGISIAARSVRLNMYHRLKGGPERLLPIDAKYAMRGETEF
jgi:hypothetical protein